MKFNLKNAALSLFTIGLLTACGGSDDNGDGNTSGPIEQITKSKERIESLEILESDENFTIDLFDGLSSSTPMRIVSFGDVIYGEDGVQLSREDAIDAVPYTRQVGEGTPDHVVYRRAQAGVELQGSTLTVKPFTWTDELAMGETAFLELEYEIDNGFDNGNEDQTDDLFSYRVAIKVTGVEDVIREINLDHGDEVVLLEQAKFELPAEVRTVRSSIMPANATFPDLTYTIVNGTGSATVSEDGIMEGISIGTFTLVVASKQYPDVKTELPGRVVEPTKPVLVDITVDDVVKEKINLPIDGKGTQLGAAITPAGLDASLTEVEWEVEDTSIATIDDNGFIKIADGVTDVGKKTFVTVTTKTDNRKRTLEVEIVPAANLFFGSNFNFDDGTKEYWFPGSDDITIAASTNAAKEGSHGLEVDATNAGGRRGVYIRIDKPFASGETYRLTFWAKRVTPKNGGDWSMLNVENNSNGWQQLDDQKWYEYKDDWHEYTIDFAVPTADEGGFPSNGSVFTVRVLQGHMYYFDEFYFARLD